MNDHTLEFCPQTHKKKATTRDCCFAFYFFLFKFVFRHQVIAFSDSRVTTVMAVGEELWVGLGNGQVLIFDVIKNSAYEDEAYVVLNENKGGNFFPFPIYLLFSTYFLRGGGGGR